MELKSKNGIIQFTGPKSSAYGVMEDGTLVMEDGYFDLKFTAKTWAMPLMRVLKDSLFVDVDFAGAIVPGLGYDTIEFDLETNVLTVCGRTKPLYFTSAN